MPLQHQAEEEAKIGGQIKHEEDPVKVEADQEENPADHINNVVEGGPLPLDQ